MCQIRWLTIHAGGRREVLRHLIPALLCPAIRVSINIQDFYFFWKNDQPSLRLCLSIEEGGGKNFHQAIIQIEQMLDVVMGLHPWEEHSVLDWVGTPAPRKLSVMPDAEIGKPKPSCACPFEVAQQIHLLLEQDGAAIKDAWVHVVHLVIMMCPDVCINHQELLERIPEGIRELIPAKLEWLERSKVLSHKEPPLWVAMRTPVQSMEMDKRQELLQSVADRLAFRPDEQAYLMLVASVIKSRVNGARQ